MPPYPCQPEDSVPLSPSHCPAQHTGPWGAWGWPGHTPSVSGLLPAEKSAHLTSAGHPAPMQGSLGKWAWQQPSPHWEIAKPLTPQPPPKSRDVAARRPSPPSLPLRGFVLASQTRLGPTRPPQPHSHPGHRLRQLLGAGWVPPSPSCTQAPPHGRPWGLKSRETEEGACALGLRSVRLVFKSRHFLL